MLGLTVRCAVHTNYKPLYVVLELKAALFHGTPLHFPELYIFVTIYASYFILRIILHFRSIHCFIFQQWDRTPSLSAFCSFQIYTSDSIILYTVFTRVIHALFKTEILYLNLGCVIYARKRFYLNKSGYTGNFLNIVLKA